MQGQVRCHWTSGRFCRGSRGLHWPQQTVFPPYPNLPQAQTHKLLSSTLSLGTTQSPTYLYGMCLLPLTRARMTLPSAGKERQRPELPSRFLLSTFTQLPRSIRCKRLRPPDTAINKERQLVWASKSNFPGKQKTHHDLWRGKNPEPSPVPDSRHGCRGPVNTLSAFMAVHCCTLLSAPDLLTNSWQLTRSCRLNSVRVTNVTVFLSI